MATMLDYLDWYGGFDFSLVPFNEVDNLVLCQMAYLDLFGSVPADGTAVTVAEAASRFFTVRSAQELYRADGLVSPLTPFVLQKMAAGRRFAGARLAHYQVRFDEGMHRQFAAVTALLGDGSAFVAFRGTDDTLTGWREDFELSFSSVPAQHDALAYLNRVGTSLPDAPLRAGGHSKGGNLAVYASALCDQEVRGRLLAVYDNDGPGFVEGTLGEGDLDAVRDRVVRIVPEHCVIGQLFKRATPQVVVKSEGSGLMQHSAVNWQVMRSAFVRADGIAPDALRLGRQINQWIESVPMDRRREFVDEVFDALDAAGVSSVGELARADALALGRLMEAADALSPGSKRIVKSLAGPLVGEAVAKATAPLADLANSFVPDLAAGEPEEPTVEGMRAWRRRDKLRRQRVSPFKLLAGLRKSLLARGIGLLAAGIALIANADASHPVVPIVMVTLAGAYALALLVRFVRARKDHEAADALDAVAGSVLLIACVALLVFQTALAAFFNVLVGLMLAGYGLVLLRRCVRAHGSGEAWKASAAWGGVSFALGLLVLINPVHQLSFVLYAVGLFSVARGVADLIHEARASLRGR